jgi:hypothetical protein
LQHLRQRIRIHPKGVIVPNQDSRPPAEGSARAHLDAGSAANAAAVGHVLTAPGVFPHLNTDRAVVATYAALDAAAAGVEKNANYNDFFEKAENGSGIQEIQASRK